MLDHRTLFGTPIIMHNRLFESHDDLVLAAREHTTRSERGVFVGTGSAADDTRFEPVAAWIMEIASSEIAPNARPQSLWTWSSNQYSNPPHIHPNVSWAAIYCLEPGDPQGDDPLNGHTVLYSPLRSNYWDPGVDYLRTQSHWSARLNRGDLLLFPGYLQHSAHYSGTTPRTIVAMNIEWLPTPPNP